MPPTLHVNFAPTATFTISQATGPLTNKRKAQTMQPRRLRKTTASAVSAIQRVMQPAQVAAAGLPSTLALRLGAHIGPAARGLDRVTGRQTFIGKEVIRTARIEAVTPVAKTYVTEQSAATLHASSRVGHACE